LGAKRLREKGRLGGEKRRASLGGLWRAEGFGSLVPGERSIGVKRKKRMEGEMEEGRGSWELGRTSHRRKETDFHL